MFHLIFSSSHHMILFNVFPFDQYKLLIARYKNGTIILRFIFPIYANCPPSNVSSNQTIDYIYIRFLTTM